MSRRSRTRGVDHYCAYVANRQFGVLSRAQALASGMTKDMICDRLASGRWAVMLPNVYRICGVPPTELQFLLGAHLYAREDSVVSGLSAAAVWGLEGGRFLPAQIAAPRQLQVASPNIVGRRCASLSSCDITRLDRLPITNRVRTLIDMSAYVDERVMDIALDQVLRARPGSLRLLNERLEQLRAARLRGTRMLRALLEDRDPTMALTESELETLMRRWLMKYGFPIPVFQHWVDLPQFGPARLDAAYPEKLIGIEADSFAWHSGRAEFERDRARISEFASLGWIIVQTTSREIERYPGMPAARLGRALELRA
jgi:hypothetical protein